MQKTANNQHLGQDSSIPIKMQGENTAKLSHHFNLSFLLPGSSLVWPEMPHILEEA